MSPDGDSRLPYHFIILPYNLSENFLHLHAPSGLLSWCRKTAQNLMTIGDTHRKRWTTACAVWSLMATMPKKQQTWGFP